MAWWWPFGGARVSTGDVALLRRRCGTRTTALAACLAANKSPSACAAFETDVLLCRSTVLCPKQAEAFMKCTAVAATATKLEDMPDCSKEANNMRRCLRRFRLPKDAK
jgi:hypothetical protein